MILQNAAMCTTCHTILVSRHVHDFQTCRCKNEEKQISVDGGYDYLHHGGVDLPNYADLSLPYAGKFDDRTAAKLLIYDFQKKKWVRMIDAKPGVIFNWIRKITYQPYVEYWRKKVMPWLMCL